MVGPMSHIVLFALSAWLRGADIVFLVLHTCRTPNEQGVHSLRSPSLLPLAAVRSFKHASQLLLSTFLAGGDFLFFWHFGSRE